MTTGDTKHNLAAKGPLPDLRGFAADPRVSTTLPGGGFYRDDDILARERELIFFRSWQYAGHASRLAEPGDYLTTWVLDQNILIVRGNDGTLRAFYNVCRHRAHELLRGSGRTPVITCPYHAWSYGLDGRLRTARGSERMADFPLRDICLTPVRVDQMNGMVFVNLDADARSLAETYPGLAAEIDARVPWLDTLVLTRGMHDDTPVPAEGDLAANWKVLAENCLECYHCAPAHPAFVDLVAIGTYRIANNGSWISSLSDAGQPDNQAYPFNRDDPSQHADFWFLWPNTTLNVLPGDARFVVFRFEPASATTTRTMADILTMPGAAPNPKRDNYGRNVLWPEDEGICVAVQRGLASRGYDRGRFVVDRDMTEISEHGVHHFQRLWAQTMGFVP